MNLDRWRLDLALLDEPPKPPDYLVDGLAERGSVILLAADAGAGKSWIAADLAIAVTQGRRWLSRSVVCGRALYIGAENSQRLTVRRLRAMGLRSTDKGFAYICRAPLILSDLAHRAAVQEEIEQHKPDLLVLDAAISLAGIDPNDNAAVAEFMAWVRQLAEDHDLVVLVLHHESKSQVSTGRGSAAAAKAALGAMSWRGQADLHIALELTSNPRSHKATDDGEVDTWKVKLQLPKEREFGESSGTEYVTVRSLKRDGVLLSTEVVSEAAQTAAQAPTYELLADKLLAAIAESEDGEIPRKRAVEINDGKENGTLDQALKDPRIEKRGRGRYGAQIP